MATRPLHRLAQPDFLNGAVLIATPLARHPLETYLKELEHRLGRLQLADKNGPRTMDLDIIAWNGMIVSDDYYQRDFVRRAVDDLLAMAS